MNKKVISINAWPDEDRPREKLWKKGEHALDDSELLAILLRTGVKGQSAIDLARTILIEFQTFRQMSYATLLQWKNFKGLGKAKISQIKAAIEIGRRFGEESIKEGMTIDCSDDVVKILMPRMRDLRKEVFKVIYLNSKNHVIHMGEVTQGTVNYAAPIMREIFETALHRYAVSLICVHNHPSGDPTPSIEDKQFTEECLKAAKVLQINILDHVIIGNNEYYSFADSGLL